MLLPLEEVDVPGGDDADQLPAHGAVVCDGDAAEAVARLGRKDVPHALRRAHHHRVRDEALLVALGEGGREGDWGGGGEDKVVGKEGEIQR